MFILFRRLYAASSIRRGGFCAQYGTSVNTKTRSAGGICPSYYRAERSPTWRKGEKRPFDILKSPYAQAHFRESDCHFFPFHSCMVSFETQCAESFDAFTGHKLAQDKVHPSKQKRDWGRHRRFSFLLQPLMLSLSQPTTVRGATSRVPARCSCIKCMVAVAGGRSFIFLV